MVKKLRKTVKKTKKKASKKTKKKPFKKTVKKLIEQNTEKPSGVKLKKTRIKVIGIGGGGGNIISEIAHRLKKASFVAVNTDVQALREANRQVQRFQFGENLTQGLGTGMNPEIAETAAQNEKDKITRLLEGQDLCIIIGCLGGGTASGAAPLFAKISRSLGNLTYGIFTLPFEFEGEKKKDIAKNALEKIKPYLNAVTIVPNEGIFKIIDKTTPLKQALSIMNKNLSAGLEGLIEVIYEPGLINIDFADLKTILEGRGRLAYLNTVELPRKEGVIQEAIEKVLNSPLYSYSIKGGKSVLLNIAGEKELSLNEVNQISKTIAERVNKEAKIIFGISQGREYQGMIKTTLLVTGCGTKIFSDGERKRPKKSKKKVNNRKTNKSVVRKNNPPSKKKKSKTKKPKMPKPKEKPRKNRQIKKKVIVQPEFSQEEIPVQNEEKTGPILYVKNQGAENGTAVRKNALQIRREIEQEEAKMLAEEKEWETPTFLRQRKISKA